MPSDIFSFRLTPAEIAKLSNFKLERESLTLCAKRLLLEVINGQTDRSTTDVKPTNAVEQVVIQRLNTDEAMLTLFVNTLVDARQREVMATIKLAWDQKFGELAGRLERLEIQSELRETTTRHTQNSGDNLGNVEQVVKQAAGRKDEGDAGEGTPPILAPRSPAGYQPEQQERQGVIQLGDRIEHTVGAKGTQLDVAKVVAQGDLPDVEQTVVQRLELDGLPDVEQVVAQDALPDVAQDALPDVAPGDLVDVQQSITQDVELDAMPDVEQAVAQDTDVKQDIELDAMPDVEQAVEQNVAQEALPDVEQAVAQDVELEALPDVEQDVAQNVELEALPDVEQGIAQRGMPNVELVVEQDVAQEVNRVDLEVRQDVRLLGSDSATPSNGEENGHLEVVSTEQSTFPQPAPATISTFNTEALRVVPGVESESLVSDRDEISASDQPAPTTTPLFNNEVQQVFPAPGVEPGNQGASADVDKSSAEPDSDVLIDAQLIGRYRRSVVTTIDDDEYQASREPTNPTLTPSPTETLTPSLTSEIDDSGSTNLEHVPTEISDNAESTNISSTSDNGDPQAHQPDLFSSVDIPSGTGKTPERQYLTSQELSELLGVTSRAVNDNASKGHQHFRTWIGGKGKGTYAFEVVSPGSSRSPRRFLKVSD